MAAGAETVKERVWGNTLGQSSLCPGPNLIEMNSVCFGVGTREGVRYQLLL